jgi:RNA polymerase sigma factor (sigma-70 family)
VPSADPAVDRRVVLEQALARLTLRQRSVVVLRYYDDLTEQQTADAMGVAVGTVKSQTHLALRRLREGAPELAELLEENP